MFKSNGHIVGLSGVAAGAAILGLAITGTAYAETTGIGGGQVGADRVVSPSSAAYGDEHRAAGAGSIGPRSYRAQEPAAPGGRLRSIGAQRFRSDLVDDVDPVAPTDGVPGFRPMHKSNGAIEDLGEKYNEHFDEDSLGSKNDSGKGHDDSDDILSHRNITIF